MKNILLLILLAAVAFGGWFIGHRGAAPGTATAQSGRQVRFYQSPMHPWIKADKPGRCTICGMELVAVYEGEKGFDADGKQITLSKEAVTVTGVESAVVTRQPLRRVIRVAGMIDDDDTKHRRLSATVDGRVEKLFVNQVGGEVTAGQPLATLYSPALRSAIADYRSIAQQPQSVSREHLLTGIRERLLRLGLTLADIEAAGTQTELPAELKVIAPISGTVVSRNVYEGQYVKEGDVLFELGDFSKMWFVFDAYERDLPWVRVGDEVEISTPALPGRVLRAPITFIDPNLNAETRSAKIRVVLDNPADLDAGKNRRQLLHKLYAEGRITTVSAPTLTVPRSAVLWPAGKPIVFVVKSEGAYELRDVQTGGAADDVWEIAGGLKEGDRVVTTGNLLLDSQAQINRPHEAPKNTLSDAQRSAALDFFTAIAALGDALSADKPADFKTAAAKLTAPTAALTATFGERVAKLAALTSLPGGGDLASERAAFYPLSEAAAEFALALRREDSGLSTVRVFACDMAKGAVPSAPRERGHWIQMKSELQNPWWGAEMLECGAEVKP